MLYKLTDTKSEGFDVYTEKIVRAHTEGRARALANKTVGDEGKIWTDKSRVTCVKVPTSGPEGEILGAFKAG